MAAVWRLSSKIIFRASGGAKLHSHGKCCASFGTYSRNLQRRDQVTRDQSNAEFMEDETKKYEMGKRWLAKMMGADPETFTDSDVEESLQYLLPTKLFAKDARPLMKNPTELYPKRKRLFSPDGRPIHPAFFTGAEAFQDLIYEIFQYSKMSGEKEESLSTPEVADEDKESERVEKQYGKETRLRWLNHKELQTLLGEELTPKNYDVIIHRFKKLAMEKTNFSEIQTFLEKYQTPVEREGSRLNIGTLDDAGKARGKGYRKRAMAEVWVYNGDGKIVVNDAPLVEYFYKDEDRHQVLHPFIQLDCLGKFDVECNVIGGGITGQAGAIRLAISRALLIISIDFLEPLQKAGLLTRDRRFVERKKPGQKKARKKFAWVRR